MFGGSTGELALIFLLCLLVFGPERLPALARNLGKFIRRSRLLLQSTWNQLEEEIDREDKADRRRRSADALGLSSPHPCPMRRKRTAPVGRAGRRRDGTNAMIGKTTAELPLPVRTCRSAGEQPC